MRIGKTIPELAQYLRCKYAGCKLSNFQLRRYCDLAEARGANVPRVRRIRVIPRRTAEQIERDLVAAGVLRKSDPTGSASNV